MVEGSRSRVNNCKNNPLNLTPYILYTGYLSFTIVTERSSVNFLLNCAS